MICDCCGKKKKRFESYAELRYQDSILNLCVDCNDLAYKVRDDAHDNNKVLFEKHLTEWEKRAKKKSKLFAKWQVDYIEKQKQVMKQNEVNRKGNDNGKTAID